MKRSNVTTSAVLAAVAERNRCAALFDQYPEKVVLAALEREDRRGLIECGVSLRTAWLTPAGRKAHACAHDETADVSRHDTAQPTVLCLDCGHTWEAEQ